MEMNEIFENCEKDLKKIIEDTTILFSKSENVKKYTI
jgi:hypothetical protein